MLAHFLNSSDVIYRAVVAGREEEKGIGPGKAIYDETGLLRIIGLTPFMWKAGEWCNGHKEQGRRPKAKRRGASFMMRLGHWGLPTPGWILCRFLFYPMLTFSASFSLSVYFWR